MSMPAFCTRHQGLCVRVEAYGPSSLISFSVKEGELYVALRSRQAKNWAQETYGLLKWMKNSPISRLVSFLPRLCSVKYGISLAKDGKFDDALAQYQQALQVDPKNLDAYVALGALYVLHAVSCAAGLK